jgi:hypothetical protein
VGVHDVLPQIEWTKLFLEAQGYHVKDVVLYQDNLSAMLLEKNGKASSSKRTKHLHLRYFYVKDKIDCGELRIEHCPTDKMVADFFTKPLQGTLFRKMRDYIMNIDPTSEYHSGHRSVLEHESATVSGSSLHGRVQDDVEAGWILVKKRKTNFSNEVTEKTADHEDGHSLK